MEIIMKQKSIEIYVKNQTGTWLIFEMGMK